MTAILEFLLLNSLWALLASLWVLALVKWIRSTWFANRAWCVVYLKLLLPPLILVPIQLNRSEEAPALEAKTIAPPMEMARSIESLPQLNDKPSSIDELEQRLESIVRDFPEVIAIDPTELLSDGSTAIPTADGPERLAMPREVSRSEAMELPWSNALSAIPSMLPWQLRDNRDSSQADTVAEWISILGWILVSGSLIWWVLVLIRIRSFQRMLIRCRCSEPIPESVLALAEQIRGQLGLQRLPQLEWIDANCSPMLWSGGFSTRILLPRKLWNQLDEEQQAAILTHELAHYRRCDHWLRRVEILILGLYWWNPLVWSIRRQLHQSEEACCDAVVLETLPGRATQYAEALIETAAYLSQPRWVPLASGGASPLRQLQGRLQMIFRYQSRSNRPRTIWTLLGIGLLALPIGFIAGQEPKTIQERKDKTKETMVKPTPKIPSSNLPVPVEKKALNPTVPIGVGGPVGETLPVLPSTGGPSGSALGGPYSDGSVPVSQNSRGVSRVSAQDLQQLEDEFELLMGQGKIKMAALIGAERNLKVLSEIQDDAKLQIHRKTMSQTEYLQLSKEFTKAQNELELRKAEYDEHQIRIGQIRRKLDSLNKQLKKQPAKSTPTGGMMSGGAPPLLIGGSPTGSGDTATPKSNESTADPNSLQAQILNALNEIARINSSIDKLSKQASETQEKIAIMQKSLLEIAKLGAELDKTRQSRLDEVRKLRDELEKLIEKSRRSKQ